MSDVKRPSIVSYVHRYKRPPRKKQAPALAGPAVVTERARLPDTGKTAAEPTDAAAPPPANDDRKAPSSHRGVSPRKAGSGWSWSAQADDGREVSPEVKAFLARLIRPGGALPPEKP